MAYIDLEENTLELANEPLAGVSMHTLFRLLRQNNFSVGVRYLPRVIYSLLVSGIAFPFRWTERRRFDEDVKNVEIEKPPVFLLGHWRSGTTYLHNVLAEDSQFGFFSTFDAYLPGMSLLGTDIFKSLVASSIPDRRPMDNVRMSVDFPQEDEYAVGAFSPYSYYHGWCFPRNMELYNRFVTMDDVPEWMVKEWKDLYLYLLKKQTVKSGGKRLLLKNQSNTGRVKLLLDLFPEARFVHIYRNPYHVYLSMMRFMRTVIPLYCVQSPPPFEEVEESMMDLYVEMYRAYLKERALIPDDNVVDVCYENFVREPVKEVERIYRAVDLPGFDRMRKAFSRYVLSQEEVSAHEYEVDEEVREKVYRRWGFVFEEFGYDR